MNPINRIGQKVVCIVCELEWVINVCSKLGTYPVENKTYTVAGFAENNFGSPSIFLREIPGYSCSCYKATNQPWDIRAFKPYRESKEDISTFKKILVESEEDISA